jgi:hypothetical protein
MQTSCLRLMGKKLLVSLAMEGKFSNEGLQGLEDDDDVLTAMARELVTQKGVGDSASAIWKALQEQHARLLPPSSTLDDGEHAAPPPSELLGVNGTASGLVFGSPMPKESPRRKQPVEEPVAETDCQLSLF